MSPTDLILHWRFRVHRMQLAHYETARKFDTLHLWLGLPAIVFSTVVGTTVFASLARDTYIGLQIFAGLMSVTAAVLTALQTFLKYSELSEKHRVAGAKCANLKHQIELISSMPPSTPEETRKELLIIEEHWSKIREESPTIPSRIWLRIENTLTFEEHSRRYP